MKLIKDILYNKGNVNLDIARLSALFAVVGFLAMGGYEVYQSGAFDPVEYGGGWAALCGGSGGWIYARQKYEDGNDDNGTTLP